MRVWDDANNIHDCMSHFQHGIVDVVVEGSDDSKTLNIVSYSVCHNSTQYYTSVSDTVCTSVWGY